MLQICCPIVVTWMLSLSPIFCMFVVLLDSALLSSLVLPLLSMLNTFQEGPIRYCHPYWKIYARQTQKSLASVWINSPRTRFQSWVQSAVLFRSLHRRDRGLMCVVGIPGIGLFKTIMSHLNNIPKNRSYSCQCW